MAREVTVEDMSMLAHKVCIRVGMFNTDWDVKVAAKRENNVNSGDSKKYLLMICLVGVMLL